MNGHEQFQHNFFGHESTWYFNTNEEILKKSITGETMSAVWFPPDWKKEIVKGAEKENMPIYKYLMMLHNNYQIAQDANRNT